MSQDVSSLPVYQKVSPSPESFRFAGALLTIATCCVFAVFWPTIRSMVEVWASSRTFSHGFLVLPAAGYLAWCQRRAWISLIPMPDPHGLLALIGAASGWILGHALHLVWLQQASVVGMLPGLVWTILGSAVLRVLAWPLGFLIFLIPFGTSFEPWLQDLTAWMILHGLDLSGIPYVYRDHRIYVSSGEWEVATDCAGLRYLLPGLSLGYAFVTVTYRRPFHRITFLFLCSIVLMLANGARAYAIILGNHIGIAHGTDHRVFSYTIYGLTMPALFWFGRRWQEADREPGPATVAVGLPPNSRSVMTASIGAVGILILTRLVVLLFPPSL